jgi:NlpC/P60 family
MRALAPVVAFGNPCRAPQNDRNLPNREFAITIEAMRIPAKLTVAIAVFGLALGLALAQAQNAPRRPDASQSELQAVSANRSRNSSLTQDDRLSLLAAALDSRVRQSSEPDCSHLVHAIYERAGFSYAYAPSSDLYAGVDGFQRVKQPEPGDLIVWRGHAGMVIKPSQHIFFSFMTSGPGIDDYQAPYWKGRGHPRFFRYIKDSCASCDSSQHSRRLVKIKR